MYKREGPYCSFDLRKDVFVNFPILHYHEKIFRWVIEQLNIGEWVAIHEKQVCQGALLYNSNLTRVRIAETTQSQQFGIRACGHLQSFGWREPTRQFPDA